MMRDGAITHTQQTLGSVSIGTVLDVAEAASRWEAGAPGRGQTRGDLGGEGTRAPCTLGDRFTPAPKVKREVA
jgi:hypothetical protein